jgi:hypothetical protein
MVIDARFPPVIIRSYIGTTTEKMVRESGAWIGKYLSSLRSSAKIVLITDTRAVLTTDPKMRKIAAEEAKKLEPLMRAHEVESIVIINSVMLRCAITAISWLTSLNLSPAKDPEDAFRLASESLARVGQTLPLGLMSTTYRIPTTPMSKAG